jgi:poly(hydroxyalkanoate) depolymerase family esterase
VLDKRFPQLHEAMALIKAGDLRAATAAIQRGLAGHAPQEVSREPAPGPDGGHFISGKHASPSGSRSYKLSVPQAYHGQSLPLIVMLHGCTQTPADFATGTRMNEVAGERDCFVVYPQQSRTANPQRCWNWFKSGDQRRDRGEPAIIASLVRELIAKYNIDPSRIYVAGLSAGGAMAVILGRTYPELFAAVGVHSGLPFGAAHDVTSALSAMRSGAPDASQPEVAIPTIVFHGDKDTTVHPSNGAKVAEDAMGPCTCDVKDVQPEASTGPRTFSRKLFTDADGKVIVESWLVHGAAHQWSGGDPRGSHTDAAGPNASREMVRFFLERPLRGANQGSEPPRLA